MMLDIAVVHITITPHINPFTKQTPDYVRSSLPHIFPVHILSRTR